MQFLSGQVDRGLETWIAQHLDGCARCQHVSDGLTDKRHWRRELEWLPRQYGPGRREEAPLADIVSHPKTLVHSGHEAPPDRESALHPLPFEVRFQILESLGSGGNGAVYRARDVVLGREIALKIPHRLLEVDASLRRRFITELHATSRLHHPNIVAVFDAGADGDRLYLVLELVRGRNLAEWLDQHRGPVPIRLAAGIVAELADGIEHAHGEGVIHRDLKPSNVLLDESRRCQEAAFLPRLTDFGVARMLSGEETTTIDGSIIGSPPYMSPEQAGGSRDKMGPPSDLYSLGVILYQLLSRRLPIEGASTLDTLRRIETNEPIPLRRHRAEVPADLEAICHKLLRKRPEERYPSARHLSEDLRRFLGGQPVSVRPPSWWERLANWSRRHPAPAVLTLLAFATVIAFMMMQTRHSRSLEQLNGQLQTALDSSLSATAAAQASEKRSQEVLYAAQIRRAFEAWQRGDVYESQSILNRYRDGEPARRRGSEWSYLDRLTRREHRDFGTATSATYVAVFSPDAKTLAVAGADSALRFFDFATGALISEWSTNQVEINGVAFTDDGAAVWTTGDDGTIRKFDISTQAEVMRIDAHAPDQAWSVIPIPERNLLISSGTEPVIRLWNAATGEAAGTLEGHRKSVRSLTLYPDRKRLASGGADGEFRTWDLDDRRCISTRNVGDTHVTDIAFSPDGRLAATTAINSTLTFWSTESGLELQRLQTFDELAQIRFAPKGDFIFVGDRLGVISVFRVPAAMEAAGAKTDAAALRAQDTPVAAWLAHDQRLYSIAAHPGGEEIVTTAAAGQVRSWNISSVLNDESRTWNGDIVHDFCFVPQATQIAIASATGVAIWDFGPDRSPRALSAHPSYQVAVSASASRLAAGDRDGNVTIWDLPSGKQLNERRVGDASVVSSLRFCADEHTLLACGHVENAAILFHIRSGAETARFDSAPGKHVSYVDVSANQSLFAMASETSIEVYDLPNRRLRWSANALASGARCLRISPDSRYVLAGITDRSICVWEAETGRLVHRLHGHSTVPFDVSVAPDGKTIASADGEGRYVFWSMATGDRLFSIETKQSNLFVRGEYSADGKWFAYLSGPKTIRVLRML